MEIGTACGFNRVTKMLALASMLGRQLYHGLWGSLWGNRPLIPLHWQLATGN